MKTKLLTVFLFFIVTSTQVLAQRPSIGGLNQKLDTLINALVVCPPGAPMRFVDNGDGTICDHQTGLMWEKKDAADGVPDLANPHDVDNTYTWSSAIGAAAPDGTAFTDFLPRLNGVVAELGSSPDQLGGYSDWRLPTQAELLTLLFEPSPCSISPCIIDPVFAPTSAAGDWSSTSRASVRFNAFAVRFSDGIAGIGPKSATLHVRAVRGGG